MELSNSYFFNSNTSTELSFINWVVRELYIWHSSARGEKNRKKSHAPLHFLNQFIMETVYKIMSLFAAPTPLRPGWVFMLYFFCQLLSTATQHIL